MASAFLVLVLLSHRARIAGGLAGEVDLVRDRGQEQARAETRPFEGAKECSKERAEHLAFGLLREYGQLSSVVKMQPKAETEAKAETAAPE
jgi:hypothetical protein